MHPKDLKWAEEGSTVESTADEQIAVRLALLPNRQNSRTVGAVEAEYQEEVEDLSMLPVEERKGWAACSCSPSGLIC